MNLRWAIRPVTRDMNAQQPTSNPQRPSGVAIRSPHWALPLTLLILWWAERRYGLGRCSTSS